MPAPVRQKESLESLASEIQSIDSKINLIAQKIKNMEKNEEILGRTLITLNEKVDKVAKEFMGGGKNEKNEKADEAKFATKQEVKEIKALLNQINPLQFATIDEVKELLEDTVKKMKK